VSRADYFWFYNHERQHQALEYQTPAEVYFSNLEAEVASVKVGEKFLPDLFCPNCGLDFRVHFRYLQHPREDS
jgi:hypothetical protein